MVTIDPLCRLCGPWAVCGFTWSKQQWQWYFSCHGAVVRFSLRGTTYHNNSLVTLADIGQGDDALLCITNLTACCWCPYTDPIGKQAAGNWYFSNETRVVSSGNQWDFHRTRGWMVVHMHHRRGGDDGIYCCVIPVTASIYHTVYIGVYTASTGKKLFLTRSLTSCYRPTNYNHGGDTIKSLLVWVCKCNFSPYFSIF